MSGENGQSYSTCRWSKPPDGLEKVVGCELPCFSEDVVRSGIFCLSSSYVRIPNKKYCTECEFFNDGK